MSRILFRAFISLSFILALGVGAFSIFEIKTSLSAWATLAAALAVITSVISAWGAIRIVELEEDKLRPYPYLHFDSVSRYGLMLLRLINSGQGTAHNINITWDIPLTNSEGKKVKFSPKRDYPEIPILLPGQSISMRVDTHIRFFKMDKKHEYSGYINFNDGTGKKMKHRFFLDGEMYRGTPFFEKEDLKAFHSIQQLPEKLELISKLP